MKTTYQFIIFFLCLSILGCKKNITAKKETSKNEVIANIEIAKDSLVLNGNEGNWYYKNQLFNGYSVKHYANGSLQQKVGFLNGKKYGVAQYWFRNGVLKTQSHYQENKLVGNYTTWWNNGTMALESFYINGKEEGVSKRWYKDGSLAKLRNLVEGKEVGLQKAWLKNGKLYVNYEAKNGRIFGMRRAKSCYQLKDEEVTLVKR